MPSPRIRPARAAGAVAMLLASLVCAQEAPSAAGWRRASDTPPPGPAPEPQSQNAPVPSQITIRPGTFVTVRVDQTLSSDRNQPGDAFSATLVKPIVVDGIVVAQRGQTIGARVTESHRGGRVEGVSRLGIQLTELTLVDGQQVSIQSELISRAGPTSVGRDAETIGTATALGAIIGTAADWGRGAAIGAAAGAAVGTLGVLVTRGRPTVIYPESLLTFRLETPVPIATERTAHAFRYVEPSDYDRSIDAPVRREPDDDCQRYRFGCSPYFFGPGFFPYYYGPGWTFIHGPRFFYGPRFYPGRRYVRGRRW